jgi:DNA-binding MarR family transcriptional regulator
LTNDDRQARDTGVELDRTANLLGALSLAVTDRTRDAIAQAGGHSETAATALSALYFFLDRPSIDMLRQVLGLTPSGTVRLVDRLVEAGHVERRPGDDARSVCVMLTASGRAAAERIWGARTSVLSDALGVLSGDDRETLDSLLSQVLIGMRRGPGAVRWICRLCDVHTCRRAPGGCPFRRS